MEPSFASRRSGGAAPRPAPPAARWGDASRGIKRIAANVTRGAELDARAQQQLQSAAASLRAALGAAAQQQQGLSQAERGAVWETCTSLWVSWGRRGGGRRDQGPARSSLPQALPGWRLQEAATHLYSQQSAGAGAKQASSSDNQIDALLQLAW
jgi:hypothetical protein